MAAGTTTTWTPPAGVAVSLELDASAQPGGASGGSGGAAASRRPEPHGRTTADPHGSGPA
ncbi:hypothetical protein ACH4KN_19230 [Streptomyces sp. NPDC017546]|uniref:hypothetical protein n=1 Tax=unclassified Streptomyces TaxID=2593676 RepID=UPI00235E43E1|nr:hypothetical protein [Streptomyces sp. MMBL 11-1]